MMQNCAILAINPFFDAYSQSDVFGKMLFISLFLLSMLSWIVLIYKMWLTHTTRKLSRAFRADFEKNKHHPLGLEPAQHSRWEEFSNPFSEIYRVVKQQTLEVLSKNRLFGHENHRETKVYLSASDISLVESHLLSTISDQAKKLEKNLFVLSTTVSLAPFLGLLGTVWGILVTFSELQSHASAGSSQTILGGISLALATTVLGLLVAIPALISYNYLKTTVRDFQTEMENFSNTLLATIELQYRKVDVS